MRIIQTVFRLILFFAFTLLHAYVFWRSASVPFLMRHISIKGLGVIALGLWVLLFLGLFWGHHRTGLLAETLEFCGMNWLGILLLAFSFLLAVDVLTGFGFFFRRLAPVLRGWALLIAGLLSVVAIFQGLRPPVIEDYEVRLSQLPADMDGTVVVAISDTHLGSLLGKDWLAGVVDRVNALRPDMVVFLGDILEGYGSSHEDLIPVFRRLFAPLGVWAVPGNHESYGNYHRAVRLMQKAGLHVLINRFKEIQPGFIVAGVEDLTTFRRRGIMGDQVKRTLRGRPPGTTILLSHTPWQIEAAAAAGVGLMLCGHTHGGQLWPFGYLVRLVYPMIAGEYRVDGMTVIVCRGTGTWGPRMRLWHPGEISRVTLHRAR